jgi:hypothetical protein
MNISTFEEDFFDLKGFAERLESFIAVEQNFVEGSLVVALNSKFGSGKTTFLKMWKASLEEAQKEKKYLVVSLNAWESDYLGDALFAIVSELEEVIQTSGKSPDKLMEAVKDIGWFGTAVAAQIAKKYTGIDAQAAGEWVEKNKTKRDSTGTDAADAFSVYSGRKKAMKALKEAIHSFIAESKLKLLFLVDELDRCMPDYTISYLETIKHIFDVQGAIFIVAADRDQLESSAKAAFGVDIDVKEYFRKFFHRETSLPNISEKGYQRLLEEYVFFYLKKVGERYCFMDLNYSQNYILQLLLGHKLTFRQAQEVFRILGHLMEIKDKDRGLLRPCWSASAILMSALKVVHPKNYRAIGETGIEPKEALAFLKGFLPDHEASWWFRLILTGKGIKEYDGKTPDSIMKEVGLASNGDDIRSALSTFDQDWRTNTYERPFRKIYERIEYVFNWAVAPRW